MPGGRGRWDAIGHWPGAFAADSFIATRIGLLPMVTIIWDKYVLPRWQTDDECLSGLPAVPVRHQAAGG